jgi:hypothetical protein
MTIWLPDLSKAGGVFSSRYATSLIEVLPAACRITPVYSDRAYNEHGRVFGDSQDAPWKPNTARGPAIRRAAAAQITAQLDKQ